MRVTVADHRAVNYGGQQYREGETFEADDRIAAKWLERQHVMPARPPAAKKKTVK